MKKHQRRDRELYSSINRDDKPSTNLSPNILGTKKTSTVVSSCYQRSRKGESRKSNIETPVGEYQKIPDATTNQLQNPSMLIQRNHYAINNFNDNLILLNYTSTACPPVEAI